ncbi:unnamed protein product [Prorocentrum cordatum]|uniref:Uncharacterized protein n=1 Tax=Prorocentrum cordatum TaxID=2364126 RepID=A0ABN9Q0X9_9DINO|nr:unnamed protein product [Polarella glacialis]
MSEQCQGRAEGRHAEVAARAPRGQGHGLGLHRVAAERLEARQHAVLRDAAGRACAALRFPGPPVPVPAAAGRPAEPLPEFPAALAPPPEHLPGTTPRLPLADLLLGLDREVVRSHGGRGVLPAAGPQPGRLLYRRDLLGGDRAGARRVRGLPLQGRGGDDQRGAADPGPQRPVVRELRAGRVCELDAAGAQRALRPPHEGCRRGGADPRQHHDARLRRLRRDLALRAGPVALGRGGRHQVLQGVLRAAGRLPGCGPVRQPPGNQTPGPGEVVGIPGGGGADLPAPLAARVRDSGDVGAWVSTGEAAVLGRVGLPAEAQQDLLTRALEAPVEDPLLPSRAGLRPRALHSLGTVYFRARKAVSAEGLFRAAKDAWAEQQRELGGATPRRDVQRSQGGLAYAAFLEKWEGREREGQARRPASNGGAAACWRRRASRSPRRPPPGRRWSCRRWTWAPPSTSCGQRDALAAEGGGARRKGSSVPTQVGARSAATGVGPRQQGGPLPVGASSSCRCRWR